MPPVLEVDECEHTWFGQRASEAPRALRKTPACWRRKAAGWIPDRAGAVQDGHPAAKAFILLCRSNVTAPGLASAQESMLCDVVSCLYPL